MTPIRPRPNRRTIGSAILVLCLLPALLSSSCVTPSVSGKKKSAEESPAQFHYKMATGLIYEKKAVAALKELAIGLNKDPHHARSHYLSGFLYMGRKNFSESVVHLKRALELDPKLLEARNSLAASYMGLKRWQDALDTLLPLIEEPLNPTPWLAHNNIGWCYYKLGNHIKSVQHLEMAIFHKKKFCLGYYNLGLVLKARGRLEHARLRLEQSRKLCPHHAQTLLELGDVYEALSRNSDAQNVYRSCRKIAEGTLLGERCKTREGSL
ncbi:MAG: hypothetical protein CMH54_00945 [Myxococcales bacterium]|nr:hypothetical protein [Myxococcales bacterium]